MLSLSCVSTVAGATRLVMASFTCLLVTLLLLLIFHAKGCHIQSKMRERQTVNNTAYTETKSHEVAVSRLSSDSTAVSVMTV